MIDFSVEPEFQAKLDWMNTFVREECETMDLLWPEMGACYDMGLASARAHLKPLQAQVKAQGLWACHLGPHLGGPGYGQVKLGLMNEILGRSSWAPTVFGTAAPDTGNAEILALFGTEAQKARYLAPLMAGDIVSCFSMTEPQAGADPGEFTCTATQDGDAWVIDGEKWFSSNARFAAFLMVIAVTDADAALTSRMSMFIVPRETPGIEIIRNVAIAGDSDADNGHHAHIRYNVVRVPLDHMLGERGGGFRVAQARLGGGRIHHAMRTVGKCQRFIDMMLERAVSRRTRGKQLGDHQFVQGKIADSIIALEQFRLLVLKTAWIIDEIEAGRMPHGAARNHIGMCKVAMAKVYGDIAGHALEIHGSLGISLDLPLAHAFGGYMALAFADGPTDVHRAQLAKAYLKKTRPAPGMFPTEHIPHPHRRGPRALSGSAAMTPNAPMTRDPLFDFTSKVALVTGGSRGLGLQMVMALAQRGADVIVASRKLDACEAVAEQCRALGRRALAVSAHVGRWDDCDRLIESAYAAFGRVDILINNAGMSPAMPSHEVSEVLFDSVVNLNFKGPFRLASQIAHRMRAGEGGCIINVTSSGSLMPLPGMVPYGAAKAALNAMSLSLAHEYAPEVRVNTISPGAFRTDIVQAWPDKGQGPIASPRGHAAEPHEIVTAMLFLASPASVNVTGTLVRCDGGQH